MARTKIGLGRCFFLVAVSIIFLSCNKGENISGGVPQSGSGSIKTTGRHSYLKVVPAPSSDVDILYSSEETLPRGFSGLKNPVACRSAYIESDGLLFWVVSVDITAGNVSEQSLLLHATGSGLVMPKGNNSTFFYYLENAGSAYVVFSEKELQVDKWKFINLQ